MANILLLFIYLAFISLGLPDSLLGASWPEMQQKLNVPVSYAGVLSMIISIGTIVSSLASAWLTQRIKPGMVTAASTLLSAISLFGFSVSGSFWALCLWGIPYGLAAGSIDAALNNYVAQHYSARHMSWLHSMWGIGTIVGPHIIGYVLLNGGEWTTPYLYVALLQAAIALSLFFALPLWRAFPSKNSSPAAEKKEAKPVGKNLGLRQAIALKGAKNVMVLFLSYCAVEMVGILWSGTWAFNEVGVTEAQAAKFAGYFLLGITLGRIANGFIATAINDTNSIRLGAGIMLLAGLGMLIPSTLVSGASLFCFGLGCAPIYPAIIHSTPIRFGAEASQALIGIQMASAYVGSCLMPPLFGMIARRTSFGIFPWCVLLITLLMLVLHERLAKLHKV